MGLSSRFFNLRWGAAYVHRVGLAALVGSPIWIACHSRLPVHSPEGGCIRKCTETIGQCSESECESGCNLVLDKWIGREGETILACIRKSVVCNDPAWARCAVHTGPYRDGAPTPPTNTEEDDD